MSSLYQKLRNPGEGGTDNCVVNVIPIGDELIAATETDYVHQIDSKTLDSVKRVHNQKSLMCLIKSNSWFDTY